MRRPPFPGAGFSRAATAPSAAARLAVPVVLALTGAVRGELAAPPANDPAPRPPLSPAFRERDMRELSHRLRLVVFPPVFPPGNDPAGPDAIAPRPRERQRVQDLFSQRDRDEQRSRIRDEHVRNWPPASAISPWYSSWLGVVALVALLAQAFRGRAAVNAAEDRLVALLGRVWGRFRKNRRHHPTHPDGTTPAGEDWVRYDRVTDEWPGDRSDPPEEETRPADRSAAARDYACDRGWAADLRGDFAAAIDEYSRALRHDPDHAPAYVSRGISRLRTGQTDAALLDFDIGLRLAPGGAPTVYIHRAVCRAATGAAAEALADADEAVRLAPDNHIARFVRGHVLESLGDWAAAAEQFAAASRLAPDFAEAYERWGRISALAPAAGAEVPGGATNPQRRLGEVYTRLLPPAAIGIRFARGTIFENPTSAVPLPHPLAADAGQVVPLGVARAGRDPGSVEVFLRTPADGMVRVSLARADVTWVPAPAGATPPRRLGDAPLGPGVPDLTRVLARHPGETGFWDRIAADPDDAVSRLAYADWLDESGDPHAHVFRADTPFRLGGQGLDWGRAVRVVGSDPSADVHTVWGFIRSRPGRGGVPLQLADGSAAPAFVTALLGLSAVRASRPAGPDERAWVAHYARLLGMELRESALADPDRQYVATITNVRRALVELANMAASDRLPAPAAVVARLREASAAR